MASIRHIFLMIVIVISQINDADAQFSVLATQQAEMIKLLQEISTTSTPFVPNITALLTNQETLLENSTNALNEMNTAVHQLGAAQMRMAESLDRIVTLLQGRLSEDILPQPGQTTTEIPMPTVEPTTQPEIIPTDCSNISVSDNYASGVYIIDPRDGQGSFEVYCDMDTDEGGWTVFQKRFNGSVDFYLGWDDYENGFGSLKGEHWLGLQQIHRLTSSGRWTLHVDLEAFDGTTGYAQFKDFQIGDAESFYRLSFGASSGNITAQLYNGQSFTTKDQDHDVYYGLGYNGNCALYYQGAWWFRSCVQSNLNGLYQGSSTVPNHPASQMCWNNFPTGSYYEALKKSEMKIRRTQ